MIIARSRGNCDILLIPALHQSYRATYCFLSINKLIQQNLRVNNLWGVATGQKILNREKIGNPKIVPNFVELQLQSQNPFNMEHLSVNPVTELGGGREVMLSQIKLRNTARIAMEW